MWDPDPDIDAAGEQGLQLTDNGLRRQIVWLELSQCVALWPFAGNRKTFPPNAQLSKNSKPSSSSPAPDEIVDGSSPKRRRRPLAGAS